MDSLLEPMIYLVGAAFVVWALAKLERQASRLRQAEAAIQYLYQWTGALTHRVNHVEGNVGWSAGSYRAPGAGAARAAAASAVAPDVMGAAPQPAPIRREPPIRPEPAPAPPATPRLAAPVAEPTVEPDADAAPALPRVDWERWIGVRGAAALGAGILVVALLYFLRYSMDQGWLTLTRRVLLGGAFSAACVAIAELRLRQTHVVLASWVSGAGIAGLFASVWAAQHVAMVIGAASAFAAVVLLTACAMALSLKNASQPIALLGLTGAFAAPLSLSLDGSRPVAVALYIFVLDLAMVALAVRKGWWSLAALSLLGSAAYEAVWMGGGALGTSVAVHAGLLTVMAGVFAGVPSLSGSAKVEDETPPALARATRFAGLVIPFAFTARLAWGEHASAHLLPIGALCVLLTTGAVAIARTRREAALPFVAVFGDIAVLGAYGANADVAASAVPLVALAAMAALPILGLVALESARPAPAGDGEAARGNAVLDHGLGASIIYLCAVGVMVVVASFSAPGPWATYEAALLLVAAMAAVLAQRARQAALVPAAVVALAIGFAAIAIARSVQTGPVRELMLGLATVTAAGLGARVLPDPWPGTLRAAARFGALILLGALALVSSTLTLAPYAVLLTALTLASLLCIDPAHGAGPGARPRGYVASGFAAAACVAALTWADIDWPNGAVAVFGCAIAALVLVAPYVRPLGLGQTARGPEGQAASLLLFTLALAPPWLIASLDRAGPITAALALVAAALLVLAHRPGSSLEARAGARWLGAIAIAAGSGAIALSFEREELTWGLAIFGVLLVALARRADAGRGVVAGVGSVHLAVASARVVANPELLTYHERGATPVLNWITPTILIPAACCLAAWRLSPRDEAAGEASPVLRAIHATLGLALVFAWLNLAVLDVFSTGAHLELGRVSSQAYDLSTSVVWALFGVGLLVIGLRRSAGALRWASLAIILVTAGKVFLYDLANLRDLYRVAALGGLAATLLVISMVYQRFVFSAGKAASTTPEDGPPSSNALASGRTT